MSTIVAALLLLQSAPEISPAERMAVARFVAACVDGGLTDASLREVRIAEVPESVRREFGRRRAGRYYRFDETPSSFLIVVSAERPDAEERTVCALASSVTNPWNLFGGVMNVLQPGRVQQRISNDGGPQSAGMTSEGGDYSIHAERVGDYTVIQTIQRASNRSEPSSSPQTR